MKQRTLLLLLLLLLVVVHALLNALLVRLLRIRMQKQIQMRMTPLQRLVEILGGVGVKMFRLHGQRLPLPPLCLPFP